MAKTYQRCVRVTAVSIRFQPIIVPIPSADRGRADYEPHLCLQHGPHGGQPWLTVYLVEDATATFDRMGLDGRMRPAAVHAAALSDLSEEFATIVSTADVLRALDLGEPLVAASQEATQDDQGIVVCSHR